MLTTHFRMWSGTGWLSPWCVSSSLCLLDQSTICVYSVYFVSILNLNNLSLLDLFPSPLGTMTVLQFIAEQSILPAAVSCTWSVDGVDCSVHFSWDHVLDDSMRINRRFWNDNLNSVTTSRCKRLEHSFYGSDGMDSTAVQRWLQPVPWIWHQK